MSFLSSEFGSARKPGLHSQNAALPNDSRLSGQGRQCSVFPRRKVSFGQARQRFPCRSYPSRQMQRFCVAVYVCMSTHLPEMGTLKSAGSALGTQYPLTVTCRPSIEGVFGKTARSILRSGQTLTKARILEMETQLLRVLNAM